MIKSKPLILLSNDDGVQAKGLCSLVEVLRPFGELFVMAPDGPRSGASCSITSLQPVRYRELLHEDGLTVCSCSGTPVDCVKMAFSVALKGRKPDLVVGGINHGKNSSVNVHYSGTMGVAFEGVQHGVPSMAFSSCNYSEDADFRPLYPYIRQITENVLTHGLPKGTCLNINFPDLTEFKGVRICRMAHDYWLNEYAECKHPHGDTYYWLTGDFKESDPNAEDTDSWALRNGYVAITPTLADVTDYALLKEMKNWEKQ